MNKHLSTKLQNTLALWKEGALMTSKKLKELGIDRNLAQIYKRNGWIHSFGHGAFYRAQDHIEWFGALQALQYQLSLPIHVGARTSLELQGKAHNIPLGVPTVDLLKAHLTRVPRWFSSHKWKEKLRVSTISFLPPHLEVKEFSIGSFNIKISSPERASLELLHLAPRLYSFEEVKILMESLGTLRPDVLIHLLENCSSEKVKRLLLYFGEFQQHSWRNHLKEEKFIIDSSLLKIVPKDGIYEAKYKLFLPHEYAIKNADIKF